MQYTKQELDFKVNLAILIRWRINQSFPDLTYETVDSIATKLSDQAVQEIRNELTLKEIVDGIDKTQG